MRQVIVAAAVALLAGCAQMGETPRGAPAAAQGQMQRLNLVLDSGIANRLFPGQTTPFTLSSTQIARLRSEVDLNPGMPNRNEVMAFVSGCASQPCSISVR